MSNEELRNEESDIMAEPPKKRSLFGTTKKAKIINITALVILGAVIVWCALYQMGIIGAIKL